MKLAIDTVIKNLQGKDFKDKDHDGKEIKLTLGGAMLSALLGTLPQDQGLPGNMKMLHWDLAKRVRDAQSSTSAMLEVSSDHLSLIKNRILAAYGVHVAGPICDVIESCQSKPLSLAETEANS